MTNTHKNYWRNAKQTKRMSHLLGIFLVMVAIGSRAVQAQGYVNDADGIQAPIAASIINSQNVNTSLYTGSVNYAIPIADFNGYTFGLYHNYNGFKPSIIPGPVGLGWSLNGIGVITRTVRGLKDELPSTGYSNIANNLSSTTSGSNGTFAIGLINGDYDGQPDIYHYNFGGYSGSFYLDKNGEFQVDDTTPLDIEIEYNGSDPAKIIVSSPDGVEYVFGDSLATEKMVTETKMYSMVETNGGWNNPTERIYESAWYLTEANYPDGKKIIFNYSVDTFQKDILNEGIERLSGGYTIEGTGQYPEVGDLVSQRSTSTIKDQVLTRILPSSFTFQDKELKFYYSEGRQDFGSEVKLDSLDVVVSGNLDLRYVFEYDYLSTDDRLILTSVKTFNEAGQYVPDWKFAYKDTTLSLPSLNTYQIDHWGFFNGVSSNDNATGDPVKLPEFYAKISDVYTFFSGVNRNPDPDFSSIGLLESVSLPEGGSIEFTYEPNTYSKVGTEPATEIKELILGGTETYEVGLYSNTYDTSGNFSIATSSLVLETNLLDFDGTGHPNQCNFYDVSVGNDTENGGVYIIMEGVNGTTFSKNINLNPHGECIQTITGLDSLGGTYRFKVGGAVPPGEDECNSECDPIPVTITTGKTAIINEQMTGPGHRVSEIHYNDSNPNTTDRVVQYDYDTEAGSGKSSGFLVRSISYASLAEQEIRSVYFDNQSQISLNGPPLGYSKVTEYSNTNGKTEFTFRNPETTFNCNDATLPNSYLFLGYWVDNSACRGEVMKKAIFNENGELLTLESNEHSITRVEEMVPEYKVVSVSLYDGENNNNFAYIFGYYRRPYTKHLTSTKLENLNGDIEALNETITNYGYNSVNKLLSNKTNTNTNGDVKTTSYKYAYEVYPEMDSLNMLSQPYSVSVKDDNNNVFSKNWTSWSNSISGNSNWNMEAQWQWIGDGTTTDTSAPDSTDSEVVKVMEVTEYDSYGNPLKVEDAKGNETRFFFGTNDSTLINSPNGVNGTPGVYLTGIQKIQGSADAIPTGGTRPSSGDDLFTEGRYDSRGRIVESVNENEETSSFQYDDFNRLSLAVSSASKTRMDYRYSSDFNSGVFSASDPNAVTTTIIGSDSPRDVVAAHKELTDFDGDNDVVNLGDLDSIDNADEITVSLWFKRRTDNSGTSNDTDHGVNNVLVAKSSSAANDILEIGTEGNNVEIYLDQVAGSDPTKSVNASIQNDTWYHLVFTYSSFSYNAKVFLDGELQVTWNDWTSSLANGSTSPVTLGLARPSGQQWGDFDGQIADFRIFDRALSTSEVASLYEGTESVTYLDGLGRPIQSQTRAADGTAIVTGTLYDAQGRPHITSRPIELDVSGYTNGYVNDLWGTGFDGDPGEALPTSSQIYQYYDSGFSGTTDAQYAYTQTQFEASPLSRSIAMGNAASALRIGQNESLMEYSLNNGTEEFSGFMDNELSKTTSIDPNGNHTFSFTDGWGNTIASGVNMDASGAAVDSLTRSTDDLVTEFQYDLRNQLKKVTDPRGLETDYTYNQRGQLVEKDMPDKDSTDVYRYDSNGNLRFTESAKHKNNGSTTLLIDQEEEGTFNLTMPGDGVVEFDVAMQVSGEPEVRYKFGYTDGNALYNNVFDAWETSGSGTIPIGKGNYKLEVTEESSGYPFQILHDLEFKPYKFTYNNYDELNRITETGEYYGATSFASMDDSADVTTSKVALQKFYYGEANEKAGANNTKGRLSKVEYRDLHYENLWGITWYSYNSQGLVEWIIQDLPGSAMGEKKIEYVYDELGRMTEMKFQEGTASEDYYFRYTYDELGRLAKTESRDTPTGSWLEDAAYTYFADGQLKELNLGGNDQSVDYSYNSAGWLRFINNPDGFNESSPGFPNDRFGLELRYYNNVGSGDAGYNGNIGWMEWEQQLAGTSTDEPEYGYTYDAANRLKAALYNNSTGTDDNNNGMDANFTYDKNGNLTTIDRNGSAGSGDLFYAISHQTGTNRLVSAQVNGSGKSFSYDTNGNMTKNTINGLQTARYDSRNLPYTIKGTSMIYYAYDADGQRVSKKEGSTTTYYIRGADGQTIAVYENGSIDKWKLLSGGEVIGTESSAGAKEYFVKDHLGSTRTVVNSSGTAVAYFDFYPYGKLMPGRYTTSNDDRYKFTGHELDEEAGLDLSYAGARYLDSEIGSWLSIDPLADSYPGWSPYNYTMGNPVNLVDPTGMAPEVHLEWDRGKEYLVVDQGDNIFDIIRFMYDNNISSLNFDEGNLVDENGQGIPGARASTGRTFDEVGMNNIQPLYGTPPISGGFIKNPRSLLKGWTWIKALVAPSRIKANNIKELKTLVKTLSKPNSSDLTQKELNQLEKLVNKFGGKVRRDFNPVKQANGRLDPHVQIEGFGNSIKSRHIFVQKGVK